MVAYHGTSRIQHLAPRIHIGVRNGNLRQGNLRTVGEFVNAAVPQNGQKSTVPEIDTPHPDPETSRAYWREQFSLPFGQGSVTGRHRSLGGGPHQTAEVELTFTGDHMERLCRLVPGGVDSAYAVVTAALAVCLARYTGQDRVCVGTPPRRDAGTPTAASLLPVWYDVRRELPFRELLHQVTDRLRAAYRHQGEVPDTAAEHGPGSTGASGGPPAHPPFEVLCRPSAGHQPARPANVLMDIALSRHPSGVTGSLTFDTTVWDEQRARWLRDHLRHVMERADQDPGLPVSRLCELPGALRHRLVVEWNRTDVPEPVRPALHRLVERRAAESGDRVAVRAEGVTLTYGELNGRANQLARWLGETAGVGPGQLVAVCLERSAEMIVTLLAILKTGAAYVPLDPTHPPARLQYVLEDAQAAVVVTRSCLLHRLPPTLVPVVLLNEIADDLARRDAGDLAPDGTTAPLACVIYTSGTTGRSKGVMLTHRGLCNSLEWERVTYRLTPDDRLLHMAAFSFSLAIVEVFGPLCAGAQVVVAPPEATRDSGCIARLVAEYGITLLSVVPSELKLLLEEEPAMPWTALRSVITGADVLPVPVLQRYFATCPSVPLFNVYGQTESSVDTTFMVCRPSATLSNVPIGRPISNTRAYVLDQEMRLVPVGVPGQLYVGGSGLALGYLGRPDLTAERFVPDPFGVEPGGRLYRSGDIVRWLADGDLELLGRDDHQVQVHGIRVELEEIESALREHPRVADAAVAVRRQTGPPRHAPAPGDPEWTAYLSRFGEDTVERLLAEVEAEL